MELSFGRNPAAPAEAARAMTSTSVWPVITTIRVVGLAPGCG